MPIAGQLNIVDAIPGDTGYNDFWLVTKVTVPASYVANTVTSYAEITAAGYTVTPTDMLVDCPIVPEGSTATLRVGTGPTGLSTGWYRDKVVKYLNFSERALQAAGGKVPVSPIYVTFNKESYRGGRGPPSGFKTEAGSQQTHNVPATLPADASYSPLWSVQVYDNAKFASVTNLATAQAATAMPAGADVNCPIVAIARSSRSRAPRSSREPRPDDDFSPKALPPIEPRFGAPTHVTAARLGSLPSTASTSRSASVG